MALKHSYTLLAPVYHSLASGALDAYRQKSLSRIKDTANKIILINGIGSGLDMPYLSDDASYVGTDITPAMLKRAKKRAATDKRNSSLDIRFQVADSQNLPFDDDSFDSIVMHLILAVVPDPVLALQEANRVLKPGRNIFIFDKFHRPGQQAMARRLLIIFIRHIATRTDVVFEDVLKPCPRLEVTSDEPALAKGWFRLIELKKYN